MLECSKFKVKLEFSLWLLTLQPWHGRGCFSVNYSIFQCSTVQCHYFSGVVIQAHLLDKTCCWFCCQLDSTSCQFRWESIRRVLTSEEVSRVTKWFDKIVNSCLVWARLTRNEEMACDETDELAETPKSIQNERSKMLCWTLNWLQKLNFRLLQSHADINRKLQKNFILEGFPVSSGQFFEKLLLGFELWTFEPWPRKHLNRP